MKKVKVVKPKDKATSQWEEFKKTAIEKGFTKKVVGDVAFMNAKGQYFKLISAMGGILEVYDESLQKRYHLYRNIE